MPRFSIIVPTHGVAGRLALALDSVLDQSFGDFELIPVCDGPDSPAGEVAAGYAARDSRVAPVHSPPADGLSGARNTGTGAASGTYLLFLDGDDVLVPGALAALDHELQRSPRRRTSSTSDTNASTGGTSRPAHRPSRRPRRGCSPRTGRRG